MIRSETVSTAGWSKGIYVVKVTVGKEDSMSNQECKDFNAALIAEARALIEKGDRMMEAEVEEIRKELGDAPEMLSMSYIAGHYFGKSRTWLYQHINGNKVNCKPLYLTRTERKQLQEALQDVG